MELSPLSMQIEKNFLWKSWLIVIRNSSFIINFREKLKAKLKLDPGPELFPTVETDEQLWSHLKKWGVEMFEMKNTIQSNNFRTSHHQFFVQKDHGLMWCKVPKAASTSLLHAYLKLAHVPHHQIPEVRCQALVKPDSLMVKYMYMVCHQRYFSPEVCLEYDYSYLDFRAPSLCATFRKQLLC